MCLEEMANKTSHKTVLMFDGNPYAQLAAVISAENITGLIFDIEGSSCF